ncbi:MAG: PucR family transcriptional regulator [Actinomycetales bacterium]
MPNPIFAASVQGLCTALLPESDDVAWGMTQRIHAQVPAYVNNHLVSDEDLLQSCRENVRGVLGTVTGVDEQGLEASRQTGRRRAGQGVPYAMMLEAFRVGGRFIWEVLLDHADEATSADLLRAGADIWTISDDFAAAASESYRQVLLDRARREHDRRATVVAALLDGAGTGTESDWSAASVLDLRGTEFVVVSGECETPGVEALPDIEQILARHHVQSAWRLSTVRHEGVVALRVGFGLTALVRQFEAAGARVGISATFANLQSAPPALRQARLACAATSDHPQVLRFTDRPLAVLLAEAPAAAAQIRQVLAPVIERGEPDASTLLGTARAWFEAGGSTSTVAQTHHLHRNTVRYRLGRLKELTGLDVSDPVEAALVLLALEAVRLRGPQIPD